MENEEHHRFRNPIRKRSSLYIQYIDIEKEDPQKKKYIYIYICVYIQEMQGIHSYGKAIADTKIKHCNIAIF